MSHNGEGLAGVTAAQYLDGAENAIAHLPKTLAIGELHLCRMFHPLRLQLRTCSSISAYGLPSKAPKLSSESSSNAVTVQIAANGNELSALQAADARTRVDSGQTASRHA